MTSGSDDFLLTLNVWSFKSRHVELGTFEIPVVGGEFRISLARKSENVCNLSDIFNRTMTSGRTLRAHTAVAKFCILQAQVIAAVGRQLAIPRSLEYCTILYKTRFVLDKV